MTDKATIDNCKSKFAELHELREKALKSDDVEFVRQVMEKFSNMWLNTDCDLAWHRCILDGSLHGAEEILTRSLEKAKRFKD